MTRCGLVTCTLHQFARFEYWHQLGEKLESMLQSKKTIRKRTYLELFNRTHDYKLTAECPDRMSKSKRLINNEYIVVEHFGGRVCT